MSINQIEFGFVAALEREVSGIVRSWSRRDVRIATGQRTIYYNERAVLICAGTGTLQAYAAAKELIENWAPRMIISIGFAGSCVREVRPGALVVPVDVVEFGSGRTLPCVFGSGRLVTLDHVAGKSLKGEALTRYEARAVDMEAAGVAAAALEGNCGFAAIKAISDGADENLEFVSDFVRPSGFATGRFVAHIVPRPWLWPSVASLKRNSQLASVALAGAVSEFMTDWRNFSAKHSPSAVQVRLEESC